MCYTNVIPVIIVTEKIAIVIVNVKTKVLVNYVYNFDSLYRINKKISWNENLVIRKIHDLLVFLISYSRELQQSKADNSVWNPLTSEIAGLIHDARMYDVSFIQAHLEYIFDTMKIILQNPKNALCVSLKNSLVLKSVGNV